MVRPSPELLNQLNYILEDDQWSISAADASLYLCAKSHSGSMLLTGDKEPRNFAEEKRLEVHGTIWLFQQFLRSEISTPVELCSALQKLRDDKTVRLPHRKLSALIEEVRARV